MGAVSEYFDNIKNTVTTIFEGMAVTASHFMRKPYTVQYPDRIPVRVQDTLPYRYRGILNVDLEICTGCLACERACPIDCIVIACEKDQKTKILTISQFDIDIIKCMYCGLCSEPCPTGAIHHTSEFEGADFSTESMIRRFVTDPIDAYKPKKGPETDERIAPILNRGMRYVNEFAQGGEAWNGGVVDDGAAASGADDEEEAAAKQ
jgi:NADH-quinone oxidoreductase subunit I